VSSLSVKRVGFDSVGQMLACKTELRRRKGNAKGLFVVACSLSGNERTEKGDPHCQEDAYQLGDKAAIVYLAILQVVLDRR